MSIDKNIPPPLILTSLDQGPEAAKALVAGINQTAKGLAEIQDGLTSGDIAALNALAAPLINSPQLSPPDKTALITWLSSLTAYKASTPPSTGSSQALTFLAGPSEHNPYLTPGVMAILAPILSELSVIMTDIMRQSSLLQQSMMMLTVSMAGEVFKQAIAAGDAKVKQLQMEIAQSIVSCVTAAVQLLASGALLAYNEKSISEMKAPVTQKENKVKDLEARRNGTEKDIDDRIADKNVEIKDLEKSKVKDPQTDADRQTNADIDAKVKSKEAERDTLLETKHLNHEIKAKEYEVSRMKEADPNDPKIAVEEAKLKELTDKKASESTALDKEIETAKADLDKAKSLYGGEMSNLGTKFQVFNQVISQVGQMVTSGSQAVTTALKIPAVLDEAMANAMKDMLSQLLQLVNTTMSSAQQEGQSADKVWEGYNQLFRDFGSTITRAMYQG